MSIMRRYDKPQDTAEAPPVIADSAVNTVALSMEESDEDPEGPSPESIAAASPVPPPDFWVQLIDTLRNNKMVDQENAAILHAQAMKKALRPENELSPMISVYNPKGETKYPRPKPTHIFMMGPYPIAEPGNYDTVTWTEIELLNQLTPGDYPVTKADGTTVRVSVRTEFDSGGVKPYKTTLIMPIADDDQKASWPPLMQVLTEMITGEPPTQSYARMQAIIERQAAELARLQAKDVKRGVKHG